jgi:hypothetical protein
MSARVKYRMPQISQCTSWNDTMVLTVKFVKANGQKFKIKSILFFLKSVNIGDGIFTGK